VDGEGRPIRLSTTGFYSALGRIRDMLGESSELQRIVDLFLRERGER
jgi:hypothetical protein